MTPEEITAYQNTLARLGFYSGPADGVLSPATTAAIKTFQDTTGANGAGTGELDDMTRHVLNESANDPVYSDPKYLAFLRMSGVDSANIRNEIQARIDQANRETNRAAAGFEQRKQEQVRGIGLDFEERGLNQSGERMRSQGEAAAKVDYDRQMEEAARNDALANANRQADQDLAKLARQRSEEELGARTRIAEKRGAQTYQAGA